MQKYYRKKVGEDYYSIRRRNPDGTYDHLYFEDNWNSKQTVRLLNQEADEKQEVEHTEA